tara:strand:+ start:180 stop:335 length:156 start_codon:yes stop_codon:yes gene_type:complete
MKLEIDEVFFLKSAMGNVQIKASDAPAVAAILSKLDKEFVRLQKLQEKQNA